MVNPAFSKDLSPSLFPHALPDCEYPGHVDRLIATHAYLCRRGARKFLRAGLERCDLEQVAAIGLIKAARRFDPSSGTPFEAFAWLTILGELMHYVRDHERLVRIPRRLRALETSYRRSRDGYVSRLGHEPLDAEIAAAMGVDERTVSEVRQAASSEMVLSLEDPGARALASLSPLGAEDRLLVADAFARLNPTERRIVIGVDVLGLSQLAIGRALGLSPRRVSRMRRAALTAMQRSWASQ